MPLRRHVGFLVLLAGAVVLRLAVMWAYRPAFWYDGDSGSYLLSASLPVGPHPTRPTGYVLFLKALRPTDSVVWVVALQHLLGLAVAMATYILLQRRDVSRVVSCLAVSPLLFDAVLVTIEHYILVDALYASLLFAGVLALLWRPAPSIGACLGSGLLLVAAWFVKPLALPVMVVLLCYLLLRGVGWRRCVAFALGFALPCIGVLVWVEGRTNPYGSNNLALYGRVAGFANCERLTLTAEERMLCPPLRLRGHRPDWYAWVRDSPGFNYRREDASSPLLRDFAVAVVRQQPGDYLRTVARETAAHLLPGVDLGPEYGCLHGRYTMPASTRSSRTETRRCHPELASAHFLLQAADPGLNPSATALSRNLAAYSRFVRTPPLLVTAAVLLAVVAFPARRHGRARSLGRDAALLAAISGAVIVLPVMVGMYEPRYALPALPLLSVAAGLSVHALTTRVGRQGDLG